MLGSTNTSCLHFVVWVILESDNNSEVSDWRIEGDDHLYLLAEDSQVLSS